jgi:hypothetical protein
MVEEGVGATGIQRPEFGCVYVTEHPKAATENGSNPATRAGRVEYPEAVARGQDFLIEMMESIDGSLEAVGAVGNAERFQSGCGKREAFSKVLWETSAQTSGGSHRCDRGLPQDRQPRQLP